MESSWFTRCSGSIRKQKVEVEKRYGIRFGQTDVYCAKCGKRWPGCTHFPPTKQEYNRLGRTLDDYREDLGIKAGMSKEEAFEKFREWQQTKKTCQRCEGEKYKDCCPVHLICEEANERNAKRNDNGRRTSQIDEPKTLRAELSQARKRASLR